MDKREIVKTIKNELENAIFLEMSYIELGQEKICYSLGYIDINKISYTRYINTNDRRIDLTNHINYNILSISKSGYYKLSGEKSQVYNNTNYIDNSIDGNIFNKCIRLKYKDFDISFSEKLKYISTNKKYAEKSPVLDITYKLYKCINDQFKTWISYSRIINLIKIYITKSNYQFLLDNILYDDTIEELDELKIIFIDEYADVDVSNQIKSMPQFKPLSNYECIKAHINYLQYTKERF